MAYLGGISAKLEKRLSLARKYGPTTQAIAERIAAKYGGYTTPINYKSYNSAMRKVTNEQGGDVTELKDLARTTIIVPKDKIDNVIRDLKAEKHFGRYKQQTPDTMEGYSGNIVNLKFGKDFYTEIQVNTEKMIYAKERMSDAVRVIGAQRYRQIFNETKIPGGWGHSMYEDFRAISNKNRRGMTVKKGKAKGETNKNYITRQNSRDYYDIFNK